MVLMGKGKRRRDKTMVVMELVERAERADREYSLLCTEYKE